MPPWPKGPFRAGGGTLYAWDLNVETNGESAAAIRSDRGSGTMVVDGGSSYTVTVASNTADADVSGASAAEDWAGYEVAGPEDAAGGRMG